MLGGDWGLELLRVVAFGGFGVWCGGPEVLVRVGSLRPVSRVGRDPLWRKGFRVAILSVRSRPSEIPRSA